MSRNPPISVREVMKAIDHACNCYQKAVAAVMQPGWVQQQATHPTGTTLPTARASEPMPAPPLTELSAAIRHQ